MISENTFNTPYWYALYTRPRHEKTVESQLQKSGIESFTPKITLRRRWSDRIKYVEEPLFKGYCFARFPLREKKAVVTKPGVMEIVNFNKRFIRVPDTAISSLRIILKNALNVDPCPYISTGDRVVIRKGPFKGFEGYVMEKRNKNTTFVISIDAIAASVKCIVDMDFVDLADGR